MFNTSSPVWDGSLEKLSKAEIQNLEKVQGRALKRIFSLPITTPYIGLIIETGVWPAEQRINYSSLMLYHNIINSSKDRLVKQRIKEQRAQKYLLWQSEDNSWRNIKLEKAVIMKSDWKRTVKDKIQNQIQKRVYKEMENQTKSSKRRQV